jgi:energy-coupling factor transport system ATP-binding protein
LSGVSFTIDAGEFVALIGENGAGKSTLCRMCNGLLKPSSGRVIVRGRDTSETLTSELARGVGFLFQNPDRQMCKNTVRDEIGLGLEFTVADPAEREARLASALAMFSLDGGREPFGLSRGERQKVALASVIAADPDALILDEPTTGLDYRECVEVLGIISRLNEKGTTVLMVSHDMEVVADYARRALALSGGRLVGDGGVREIMRDAGIMASASLLPAQIPSLAMRLADMGGEISGAFTIDELFAAIAKSRAGVESVEP